MTTSRGTGPNDTFAPDFLDFIASLNEGAVDFVLVGGYAVGVHGVVRATADLDILYRRTGDNVERLCRALHEFGAPPHLIDPAALLAPDTVTMFGAPPLRIDLLGDISGVSFEQVWAGSVDVVLQDQPLRVIGLAELRVNKAATGRPRDIDDLRRLAAAARPGAAPGA
ncbi:MAG: hypothetical protein ACYC1S_07990 [Gemmatimonadaceae bacterium]